MRDGAGSSPPIILGDAVVTSVPPERDGSGSGVVTARGLSDGAVLWQKSMGNSPVVYGAAEDVTLAADDTALVALRASDGAQLWSFPQAQDSPGVRAIVEGVVILGYATSRQIVALDLHTGAVYWQTML